MRRSTVPDPVEEFIAEALTERGIRFERQDNTWPRLDFYLPDLDVYIEVKRFHSIRIADQMSRVPNVIAIQGMKAAAAFIQLIGATLRMMPRA